VQILKLAVERRLDMGCSKCGRDLPAGMGAHLIDDTTGVWCPGDDSPAVKPADTTPLADVNGGFCE